MFLIAHGQNRVRFCGFYKGTASIPPPPSPLPDQPNSRPQGKCDELKTLDPMKRNFSLYSQRSLSTLFQIFYSMMH